MRLRFDQRARRFQRRQLGAGQLLPAGALPAFDGLIRTRPLAMQNEGTSTAFITCSMGGLREFGTNADTVEYEITVSNNSQQQREIICTAVSGSAGAPGSVQASTKGFSLAPGGEGVLEWNNDNFSGVAIPLLVSYSCQLPPGGAVNDMHVRYDDGVPAEADVFHRATSNHRKIDLKPSSQLRNRSGSG